MAFKEKSAWVMTALLTGLGIYYVYDVWQASLAASGTAAPNIALISFTTAMLIAGAVIAHILIAGIAPQDASAPDDERDKIVITRAGNIAGYVLGFGVFASLWHYYFLKDGNLMFHILVVSLIVAQIADYVLTIYFYRRGV